VHGVTYKRSFQETYIPKADGRQRPLGIAALEDKSFSTGGEILNQIYEEDLPGLLIWFPTWTGTHDALDALWGGDHEEER